MWRKHQATASNPNKNNTSLVVIFFVLIVFGLIMLASASSVIGYTNFNDNYYYLKHQLLYGFLPGLILFFICSKINYKLWQKYASLFFLASLILLCLVFVPGVGAKYNNAKSWLLIAGISIQPAEIAKLALIIFLSAWFAKAKEHVSTFSHGLLPFVIFLALLAVPIALQPDIGTLLIIVLIGASIYFSAGVKWKHLIGLFLTMGGAFAALVVSAPYRFNRILAFLNPELDTQGIGYHINQALIAIGSGGILGLGLGKSRQKFEFLPEVAGDSIFAIMAEEMGFICCVIFVIFLLYFIFKILKIASRHDDEFAKCFSLGLAVWIGCQTLFNIGAMTGILPLTGVPLPFISYGGTALMTLMAAGGILVNMNKK